MQPLWLHSWFPCSYFVATINHKKVTILHTSNTRVASLAWITLLQISIASKISHQTADIGTQVKVLMYANTPCISFIVFAIKLNSNRPCNANWIPLRWDAKDVVHWSLADHRMSDMPWREQPMRVISNSHRFWLERNKLYIVWTVPKYVIVPGKH